MHPLWEWGIDLFWIAFIAAYPEFPNGSWPFWDTRIPCKGTFLTTWLRNEAPRRVNADPEIRTLLIRGKMWEEFQERLHLLGYTAFSD